MPTKKQRRRRRKDRRHEWEYVYVDESGQEVAVEPEADEGGPARPVPKGTRPAQTKAKSAPAKRTSRYVREPVEPSWSRSARRALPWQAIMVVLVLFVFRSQPLASRLFFAAVYALLFIPFTYWVEKVAWQRHLRSTGQLPPRGKKPDKPKS